MTNWGPIIDHNGGPCPLPAGTYLRVWMANGQKYEGPLHQPAGDGWDWSGPTDPHTFAHVLSYQLPRARVRLVCDSLADMIEVPL